MVSTVTGNLGLSAPLELGASILSPAVGSHSIQGGMSIGSFPSHSIQGGMSQGSFVSQSIQGGMSQGSFVSQSIQGGMSVTNWTVTFGLPGVQNGTCWFNLWVKVASLPASDMSLFDLDAGPTGYMRLKMTSTGHVVGEEAFSGQAVSVDLTPTSPVAINTWCWMTLFQSNTGVSGKFAISGYLYHPGGVTEGRQDSANSGTAGTAYASIGCRAGIGVSLSSGYLNFPNSTGNELSKFTMFEGNTSFVSGPTTPPAADVAANTDLHQLMMRQSVGATTDLPDTGTAAIDMTVVSPNGCTTVLDGPYAT